MKKTLIKILIYTCCITIHDSLADHGTGIDKASESRHPQENEQLTRLFNQDQIARKLSHDEIDWNVLNHKDKNRREKVLKMLAEGRIKTSKDFYHAALIFQHGNNAEDIRLAHALTTIAATLAEDKSKANWLKAATWDRLMMNLNQPQWYGTQFVKDPSGNWSLYDIDPDIISDQQRIDWSVRVIEESKALEKSLNNTKEGKH
ncbi:hypothetical protein ACJJIP_08930 [Microbulbifer sp. VTAC004]|uniref:hypothetical protein n=1 Tax=Microbulbifer sp. VTAC004 TaxID=3243386 RepID=UPI0040391D17